MKKRETRSKRRNSKEIEAVKVSREKAWSTGSSSSPKIKRVTLGVTKRRRDEELSVIQSVSQSLMRLITVESRQEEEKDTHSNSTLLCWKRRVVLEERPLFVMQGMRRWVAWVKKRGQRRSHLSSSDSETDQSVPQDMNVEGEDESAIHY